MPNDYENTSLWRAALAPREIDEFTHQRERLRVAYTSFRNRAGALVSRIQTHLPGLTLHDITHLDSLWETASLVAGPDYNYLNALEGFVLGGAILLHDAALCFEAYNGGTVDVKVVVA